MIVIASRLTIVMIANAVDEDHQHCPADEEQNRGRERIDQHADLQPRLTRRDPIDRGGKWMFAKMLDLDRVPKNNHGSQPGEESRADCHRMT